MWFNERINHGLCIKEIILNFLPSWWYKNYGIEYGKSMIFDLNSRIEADREMRRTFYERYGRFLGAGTDNPRPRSVLPDWDNTYYQAMVGFDVRYPVDQYPVAHGCLSDEEVFDLKVPENLWEVYPFCELARQTREINRKLNTDRPLWMRTRGLLNEAIQLCSTDFYGELLDEDCEDKRDHIFRFVSGVIEQQLLSNKKYDASSGHIMMNCTAGVAGARAYSEAVFSYDKALYDFCLKNNIGIGLHHCGKFDDFVDVYAPMTKLNFLEIGHTSKIKPVLDRYPDAQVQYIVDAVFMQSASKEQVSEFAKGVRSQITGNEGRFHISIPDLDFGTPDDNIFALIDVFRK